MRAEAEVNCVFSTILLTNDPNIYTMYSIYKSPPFKQSADCSKSVIKSVELQFELPNRVWVGHLSFASDHCVGCGFFLSHMVIFGGNLGHLWLPWHRWPTSRNHLWYRDQRWPLAKLRWVTQTLPRMYKFHFTNPFCNKLSMPFLKKMFTTKIKT